MVSVAIIACCIAGYGTRTASSTPSDCCLDVFFGWHDWIATPRESHEASGCPSAPRYVGSGGKKLEVVIGGLIFGIFARWLGHYLGHRSSFRDLSGELGDAG